MYNVHVNKDCTKEREFVLSRRMILCRMIAQRLFLVAFAIWLMGMLLLGTSAFAEQGFPRIGQRLNNDQVAEFAELALAGIDREYPNKPSNVMVDRESVLSPKEMHPVFYGSFDWHSSVHGHWMLIRLVVVESLTDARKPLLRKCRCAKQ